MAGGEESISDTEKVRIGSAFLQHAPPGEFNEVFNAVRMLLNNDNLLKEGCGPAIVQYNKDQLSPVKLDTVERHTVISPYNDLGNGRFFDDNAKKSFKYDHLRKEAVDIQPYQGEGGAAEQWRSIVQKELDHYLESHFGKSAVGCAFAKNGIHVCIESHNFQPKNFCNGRWRSVWHLPGGDGKTGSQELKGTIRVQVHYYEDGNVQLFSEKEVSAKVNLTTDHEKNAREILQIIRDEEAKYQLAVQENYTCMSDVTFKALRRQLPVIGTKMDWNKVPSYRVGQEMKPQ